MLLSLLRHCCAAYNPPLAHALMTQAPVEILVNFGEFQCSCSSQFWPKIVRILCVVKPKINFGCPQCIVEPTMHCRLTMRDNASQFYPTFGDVLDQQQIWRAFTLSHWFNKLFIFIASLTNSRLKKKHSPRRLILKSNDPPLLSFPTGSSHGKELKIAL